LRPKEEEYRYTLGLKYLLFLKTTVKKVQLHKRTLT